MPIAQIAPITVSSRCRARRLTSPMTSAASSAAATAPYSGCSQVQPPTTFSQRAAPMPPSTQCAMAPAM